MPTKIKKKFDAVAFMRKQRDRISKKTADMDFEQLKEYFNKRLKKEQDGTLQLRLAFVGGWTLLF